MLGAIFAYLMLIKWWRKERDLYKIEWRIKSADLDFTSSTETASQQVAKHKDETVVVNKLKKKHVCDNRSLLTEMATLKSLNHESLAKFIGVCIDHGNVCSTWEFCSNGTLEDVLDNPQMRPESKRFMVAMNLCSGLQYLHTSGPGYHGRLKATNCLVDSQWSVKLSNFGMATLRKGEDQSGDFHSDHICKDLLWTAPERLRCVLDKKPQKLTKSSDVFSLGVVLKQIFCGNTAYAEKDQATSKDVVMKIAYPKEDQPFMRPETDAILKQYRRPIASDLQRLVESCWEEDPSERPGVKEVYKQLKRLRPRRGSINPVKMRGFAKRYSKQLELILSEQVDLPQGSGNSTANSSTTCSPLVMLTREIKEESKQAKVYSGVTICFCSIVDFVSLVYQSSPSEIVETINRLQSHFGKIIQNSDVCAVETVVDALMLVCGCPDINNDHATTAADVALTLLSSLEKFTIPHHPKARLRLRMGLHSGPVAAGMIGSTVSKFCLFGNSVDLTLQIESLGHAQKIHMSESTFQLIKDCSRFVTEKRGTTEIKGKGLIQTYWLKGKKA